MKFSRFSEKRLRSRKTVKRPAHDITNNSVAIPDISSIYLCIIMPKLKNDMMLH